MTKRVATCACGNLSVLCQGEPVRLSICHCKSCQKRTGSAFSVNARFKSEDVTTSGDSRTFTRLGDSGKELTFYFCPACGSTVYWKLAAFPDVIAVAVGAFADPSFPPPRVSVYETYKHSWVILPDAVKEHLP